MVVRVVTLVVLLPYALVRPYCTCVSAGSLVVQVIVAPDGVMVPEETLVMTGAVVSEAFCVVPCTPLDTALQLPAVSQAWMVYVYVVAAVRPVSE